MPPGRTAQLIDANAATWDAAVGSRFVTELLAGTIADEALARYLVQDYRFFDAFTALVAQACASAPDLPARLVYARQLGLLAGEENTYFVDALDALGVPATEREAPVWHPATRAFDDLMREAATSRSYPRVVAVLVVAERLYLDWATRNDAATPAAARAEHLGWVDLHRGPAFTAWVRFLEGQLDAADVEEPGADAPREAGAQPTSEAAAVADLFARAVACEVAFFEAAYDV